MTHRHPSSFRDPAGFIFNRDKTVYRQINLNGQEQYDLFLASGLYDRLVKDGLLIAHSEEKIEPASSPAYKIIKPMAIPFISYPYEWCFSQLKDAALTTLRIQKLALAYKQSLKDASAYNIQFFNGRPVFIDTLSFEPYVNGDPWVAYRQFCQHFLAPLALMSKVDIRLSRLLRSFIDGLPLDLASKLLGKNSYLNPSLLAHIHLHAKSQKYFADKPVKRRKKNLSKHALLALLDNLCNAIKKLNWRLPQSEWAQYYEHTNYDSSSFKKKGEIVNNFLRELKPQRVWDLGANTGFFSRLATANGAYTIAFDIDYTAVEKNYQDLKNNKNKLLLPLFLDLSNPSPSLGWANQERKSLNARGPADMIMALALIHHLAIANNLPFSSISSYFGKIGNSLIIEFIPKTDSNVQRLLKSRTDIFTNYSIKSFENDFLKDWVILHKQSISGSERTLYLMKKKKENEE